uniref:Putative conserved secreted protein n=1 Tax=Ixodes ricinus TaxID=34613 RepID=A0A6B0UX45_IXORI
MFKLSFFLVFVFAGLCFGEVSSGGSSGSGPEEQNVETKSPEEGTNKETLVLLNNSVPEFVGSYEKKKELLSTFIESCNTKRRDVTSVESNTLANKETATNPSPAISLISLYFHNCTFLCKPPNNGPTFLMPMPNGTLCDKHKNRCPGDGPCPTPPIPAC